MRATEFIVEGVAEGKLNEIRDQLWTWVQSKFPRTQWPEYVQRDFLYQQAKGIRNQAELDDFLKRNRNDFGKVQWRLEKLPITMDIFTPKTQRMILSREGGSSNPYQVPKDAERHSLQQKMIQQKGVSEEPIIVAKLSNGYDLIEGWHRTIQHLKEFPQGYTAPAWVGYGATYTSESVGQDVAEGFLDEASSDEAWELVGQPVPEIQQFVKQMGYGNNEQSVAKITAFIDKAQPSQIPSASIPKLKNLANKGTDVQTLKAVQQISGRPDAEQQYTKLMKARDAAEGRNRDVSGYLQYVKSGNYDPPVLLKLPTGIYVIGGRTRLYAALALGVPANVKIISANNFKQGVAEGLDEAVGGNYLYHATSASGLKGMLSSGSIRSATGPQSATSAQTKLPTVSVTRDWGYASGSNASKQMAEIGRDAILVLDRNTIESNFKTLGTSQSTIVKGLSFNPYFKRDGEARSQNTDPMARANAKAKMKYAEPTAKAGGEFEEAVVVPKGALPLKGTMVGFWINPKSELMKDPAIMNDPRRLDMVRPNQFVKAKQEQGVAEDN